LNHRIEIHTLTSVQDETTGEITESWSLFADAWANVRPSSVREFVSAGAEQSAVTVAVKLRYIAGIKRSMRIRHGDHLYNVEGVLADPHSGQEWLTLPCSEILDE